MTPGVRVLAVWLTPAVCLQMSALILDGGPDGLWIGLALVVAPLIALGAVAGPVEAATGEREPLFPVVVLLLVAGALLWANIALAGDVAAWLGAPRWWGIAVTAALGWLLTVWRGSRRAVAALLLVALAAAAVPLVERARAAGAGPLGAWGRVATQPAFRFPASSPWVTRGRELTMARGHAPLTFDEEHRITAPAGGRLHARTTDGLRSAEIEWDLSPGQSVMLRSGDRLERTSALRVRFEADKRVPGAPRSGPAWADGVARDWPRRAGLLVTLLLGAVALLRSGLAVALSRPAAALLGGGLLAAFLWAQAWAVYSALAAPDLFLGGVTPERLLEVRALGTGPGPWRRALQSLLLAGCLAGFLGSSVALRERLGALDRTGGGEIGRDLGLWAGVFGGAALASLWPVDPWSLIVLALGGAASALAPAVLWPAPRGRPGAATLAGLVGLALFAALAAAARLGGGADGLAAAVLAYPAGAAAPAGACALWIARRGARR